jgi:hypothetical protein
MIAASKASVYKLVLNRGLLEKAGPCFFAEMSITIISF